MINSKLKNLILFLFLGVLLSSCSANKINSVNKDDLAEEDNLGVAVGTFWNSRGTGSNRYIEPTNDYNLLLPAYNYLNWGSSAGTAGYGFRDNSGTMEYKNSGGSWAEIGSGGGGGTSLWSTSTDGIYYNDGDVGIGTTNPSEKLHIVGKIFLNDGGNSVFLGEDAGKNDDETDNKNVGVGHQSLYYNTTGYHHTAIGYRSLYKNTTGYRNIAVGYQSLYNNTEGHTNVAVGYQSLYSNTTGYANMANGFLSLYSNTTGYRNTANGHQSFYKNTEGHSNSTLGYQSLYNNTTGYANTANGYQSLYSNTTGYQSVGVGHQSLYSNTTGYSNSTLGYQSLYNNTTGFGNIANGYFAGRHIADGSTGRETGDYGIYLGYDSKASADGATNEIVIGYNAIGQGSNSIVLGNDDITKTILKGDVGIGTSTPSYNLHIDESSATSTLGVGNQTAGCLIMQDTDLGGYTYCTTLNGTMTCSTDSCE